MAFIPSWAADFFTKFIEQPQLLIWAVGVVIAARQLGLLRQNTREENERKRREYALEYSLTRNASHVEARRRLNEIFGPTIDGVEPVPLETILDVINDDPAALNYIRLLLNHWENMALAIYQHVADEGTAFEMVSKRLINTVTQYENYIQYVQEGSPQSFRYLIWLEERWKLSTQKRKFRPLNIRGEGRSLV